MKREGGSCRDQNHRDFWFGKKTVPEGKRAKVEVQAGRKDLSGRRQELKKEIKEWKDAQVSRKNTEKGWLLLSA